jgi:NADH-quinone oxidoreductase subunit E
MENKPKFSAETAALVKEVISRYPDGKQKSALLPLLHLAQAEFDGWLDVPVMDLVAETLSIQPIEVYEVASFYSMYNLKPVGKCLIEVCRTSSCWLRGAEEIVQHIENKLGIKEGETTAQFHENLDTEKVDALLDQLRSEGKRKTYFDPVEVKEY